MRRAGRIVVSVLAVTLLVVGCRPKSVAPTNAPKVVVTFDHTPPSTGENTFNLSLDDAQGQPLELAKLAVEGDMNHAGMKPSFGRVKQTAPGRYTGTIDFTMGGDWFLLVSGDLPDGRHYTKKVDVPGVASK